MPVLRGEVVEIVDSENAAWRDTTRVGYRVKLKGFPEGYTPLVWPKKFRVGSKLVEAFHSSNEEKPKPDNRSFGR